MSSYQISQAAKGFSYTANTASLFYSWKCTSSWYYSPTTMLEEIIYYTRKKPLNRILHKIKSKTIHSQIRKKPRQIPSVWKLNERIVSAQYTIYRQTVSIYLEQRKSWRIVFNYWNVTSAIFSTLSKNNACCIKTKEFPIFTELRNKQRIFSAQRGYKLRQLYHGNVYLRARVYVQQTAT